MATPFLATKLSIPAAPPSLIRRARLLDRLNEGCRRKLTLVSAPAGSGKTTLVAEWAAAVRLPVAWVSLDEHDNDPRRFWTYVLTALARLGSGPRASLLLQPGSSQAPEDALAEWISEVTAGIPGDLVLILDDYHLITAPSLHRSVTFLLDHSPPTMHVVIASREDPPLPLALLRARGQLLEVRAGELGFTTAEVEAFLHRLTGLDLAAEAIATLRARTEGWAAGLQLAALSLREGANLADFLQTFAGTHRHIVDYLAEQVLQKQDPETQRFLLDTAILERLSAPLCDAVLGAPDPPQSPTPHRPPDTGGLREASSSQVTLERLERANLFLVPLDSDRRWYRYHQLFAGFLQARLRQAEPGRWAELHRRAARWFEEQGDVPQAFEHWTKAGDVEEAARLVEESGEALLECGEGKRVQAWLEQLPRQTIRQRPRLCIYQAYALAMMGRAAEVEGCLRDAAQGIQGGETAAEPAQRELLGHVACNRAFVAAIHGEAAQARALLEVALAYLPANARAARSNVYNLLGNVLAPDDAEGAKRAFEQAARLGLESESAHMAVPPALNLADIQVQQGQLHEALQTLQDARRLGMGPGGQPVPIAAHVYSGIAELLYQWNDLGAAVQCAETAVTLSRRGGSAEAIGDCSIALAWIHHAQGNSERAGALLQEVEQMVRRRGVGREKALWWAGNAMRWWIGQGQYARAERLAEECDLALDAPLNAGNAFACMQLARLWLVWGKLDEAWRLLERLLEFAGAAGRTGQVIHILTLQALALAARGEVAQATRTLEQALALAEPEGYIRLFADEGEPLARLLQELRAEKRGELAERVELKGRDSGGERAHAQLLAYIDRLLAACEEPRPSAHAVPPLIEPLNERELQILRLIATGMTYQEIARALIIAVSTVQHYVKSLYPKLGVHSGLEAVARARQLGLLL